MTSESRWTVWAVFESVFADLFRFDGYVVCEEHRDSLVLAWEEEQAFLLQKEHEVISCGFLLLARYVLNVVKRSIWDQCNIQDQPMTYWSTTNCASTIAWRWRLRKAEWYCSTSEMSSSRSSIMSLWNLLSVLFIFLAGAGWDVKW